MDVLVQTPNSEELAHTEARSDPHSTCQDEAKPNSDSKSEVTTAGKAEVTENVQDDDGGGGTENKDDAKETDDYVKSKPLSLTDKPQELTSTSEVSLPQEGTTEAGDSAPQEVVTEPTIEQENRDLEPKESDTKIELKPPTMEVNERLQSAESAITSDSADREVTIQPHPLESDNHTHSVEQKVGVASLSVTPTIKEASAVEDIPSAPALIDFSTDTHQPEAVDLTPVSPVVSVSTEVTEESSKILYPRLDSIMRGTYMFK